MSLNEGSSDFDLAKRIGGFELDSTVGSGLQYSYEEGKWPYPGMGTGVFFFVVHCGSG